MFKVKLEMSQATLQWMLRQNNQQTNFLNLTQLCVTFLFQTHPQFKAIVQVISLNSQRDSVFNIQLVKIIWCLMQGQLFIHYGNNIYIS